MADQEIIEKYKKEIEEDIQNTYKKRGIIDAEKMKKFAENYKRNFVQGFKEGVEKEKIEAAVKMIKENASVDFIQQITKLPLSTIETLKKKNSND